MVLTCLPFIWCGKNHLARHSERGKETRRTEEEVGRQHQGMDKPGERQIPEDIGEKRKWKKLVVKSSVVPKRPSRLRDRWGEVKLHFMHFLSSLGKFCCRPASIGNLRFLQRFYKSKNIYIRQKWYIYVLSFSINCFEIFIKQRFTTIFNFFLPTFSKITFKTIA